MSGSRRTTTIAVPPADASTPPTPSTSPGANPNGWWTLWWTQG